jgi:hypothetical protein
MTHKNECVVEGIKIKNNLYKMCVKVRKLQGEKTPTKPYGFDQTFEAHNYSLDWETWHKRLGHVSYTGLKKLREKNLVLGFNVDINTPSDPCQTV